MRAYAAELLGLTPDVILAHSPPGIMAAQRQTRTVPLVFVMVPAPVEIGLVASLTRPGGNITGLTHFEIPGSVLNPAPGAPPFAFGSAAQTFATTGTLRDFRLLNLAANLIWSPVSNLDIGVEVAYDRIKVSGRVVDLNKCGNVAVFPAGFNGPGTPAQVCGHTTSHEAEWRGRLRVQRSF
jgi:hypothetical protein